MEVESLEIINKLLLAKNIPAEHRKSLIELQIALQKKNQKLSKFEVYKIFMCVADIAAVIAKFII